MHYISVEQHSSRGRVLEQTLFVPHPCPLGTGLSLKVAFCHYLQLSAWGLCFHCGRWSAHTLGKLEHLGVNAPGSGCHLKMDGELGITCHHFFALSWDNMKHVLHYAQRAQLWRLTVVSGLTMPFYWFPSQCFLGSHPKLNYLHLNSYLWGNLNQEIKDQVKDQEMC